MEDRCLFEKLYSCLEENPLSQSSAERIIRTSKQYGDGIHIELEQQQEIGNIQSVPVHRQCVDRYCHKKTIQKALCEKTGVSRSPSAEDLISKPKRVRRSEHPIFSFLQHCLFCGGKCDVVKDPKHPDRWCPAYVCREGETFENRGLEEVIFEACEKRKDTQSEQIRVRMGGVFTDLHAADVRYHVDCKVTFINPKAIQAAVHKGFKTSSSELKDNAFDSVVKYLAENKPNIHNSIDIFNKYAEEGGHMLSRRQLIPKIVEMFGGEMIIIMIVTPIITRNCINTSIQIKCCQSIPHDTI